MWNIIKNIYNIIFLLAIPALLFYSEITKFMTTIPLIYRITGGIILAIIYIIASLKTIEE
jgi:hypothetical protein